MRNERIGDYLVSQGLLSEEQLQKVLAAQKESNGAKKFGDVVVELGFMTEINFTKALAGKLRVQYVDLDNTDINTDAVQKVPEALARKHTVIAIAITGKRLTVATNDPVNFIVLEDIKTTLSKPEVFFGILSEAKGLNANGENLTEDEVRQSFSNFNEVWKVMFPVERYKFIQTIIKKITLFRDQVKIEYNSEALSGLARG